MTSSKSRPHDPGRRRLLGQALAGGLLSVLGRVYRPAYAQGAPRGRRVIDLSVDTLPFTVDGRTGSAVAVNGTVPGPIVRLREGEDAVLRVANRMKQATSIHWHGIILPAAMDGVPGVSYAGIAPGETFEYRFPVVQGGTYWAHAHDPAELIGLYFPLIIEPRAPEPFRYQRDHVVVLSDWSFEDPARIIAKLKKQAGYYNYQRRTFGELVRDLRAKGWSGAMDERLEWASMRMDPTDYADVTGATYTYLVNGMSPQANWTGLFQPGERVRLRFIAAGAMTYFDVRIPNLKMMVVQADGQNVQPVEVDEFRLGPGETLDVIVQPEDRAYTLFAETMDRSGYARGTLAPRAGMSAALPERRARPLRTMADMGMDMEDMEGTDHGAMQGMDHSSMQGKDHGAMPAMDHGSMPGMDHGAMPGMEQEAAGSAAVMHGPDTHGPGNSAVPMQLRSRLDDPGEGFPEGSRVLTYARLKSIAPQPDRRAPAREIELHLTGNMERYMWSFDGKKYSEAKAPIALREGERVRLVFVNDTMMEHPIHLHGMWMELENGAGAHRPRKHTLSIKPAERLTVAVTADALGQWALHCHLLLHMELGMFRVVEVSAQAAAA